MEREPSGDQDGGVGAALQLGRGLMGSAGAGISEASIAAVRVSGPRRWWGGPLDVEGLALGSTRLAAAAVAELTDLRGRISTSSARVCAGFDSLSRLRVIDAEHPEGRAPQGFAPLSRFWPTADGWLRTHANYPHHHAALLRALGPGGGVEVGEEADRVGAVLARLTSAEAERAILAAGGVAAASRSVIAWRASAAGVAAAAAVDAHGALELLPDVAPAQGACPAQDQVPGPRWQPHGAGQRGAGQGGPAAVAPLAGLRVVEFTRVIAGPTATRTLAALGAEVIRIDPPQLPELEDQHLDTDAGKRVMHLDLHRDAATVHRHLAQAHVIVTGYRHNALAAFGLDEAALERTHPHLVRASLSAWGPGPWQERRGFDSLVQAATGIAGAYRGPDGRPGALPVQALDHATGQLLVAGIAARLRNRAVDGVGGGSVRTALAWTAESLLRLTAPTGVPVGELEPVPQVRWEGVQGRVAETELTLLASPSALNVDEVAAAPTAWGD
ncbi:CoA transferase [Galactobacter caseinivorans]|nr:CoA transferase [Galactobacter caseinivorans]